MEFTITQRGAHSLVFQGYKKEKPELKHRFASNLVSIEEYLSGVSDL